MSSVPKLAALMGYEFKHLKRDGGLFVSLLVLPAFVAYFTENAMTVAVQVSQPEANGADQAVVGSAAFISLFLINFTAYSFFRDHQWRMWDRFRSVGLPASVMASAKLMTHYCIGAFLFLVVVLVEGLLFGVQYRGSIAGMVLLSLVFIFAVISISFCIAAVVTRAQTLYAVAGIVTLALAGIGGALEPIGVLPQWVRDIAPMSPVYWLMSGYFKIGPVSGGIASVIPSVIVLIGMGLCALIIGFVFFDPNTRKVGFA